MKPKATEQEICSECYMVQDACNFIPVCRMLGDVVIQLKEAGVAHEDVRKHPAVIILVDKINDMMGRPDLGKVMDAFSYCRENRP